MQHPTLAPECKSREKLPKWLWDAIDQAKTNCGGKLPFVILHEKGRKRHLVLIELENFLPLIKEIADG